MSVCSALKTSQGVLHPKSMFSKVPKAKRCSVSMHDYTALFCPSQLELTIHSGMFLWVRLVVYDLLSQTTAQELEDALEKLPNGLDQAYASR